MKINADLSKRAAVQSEALPWLPSPLPGVERRMLERDGEEVARVTSLVRYAPNSRFSPHTHHGGEEYLVLEGAFSDEHGDFPVGSYVRNPVGSRHTPQTREGCVIFVKLFWLHPDDQAYVNVDTTREDLWTPAESPGVDVMELHRFRDETEALYRLAPSTTVAARDLPGGEELFILEGSCRDENGIYTQGAWVRSPIGEAPELHTESGCRVYFKRGHLLNPPPGPPVSD